jgi:hypothetical protein
MFLFIAGCGGPEIPEYEGKTLEEWVTRARGPVVGPAITAERQREEAMTMLGEIGSPAVEPLGEMVTHADLRISGGAVKALGKIGPEAKPAVKGLLRGLKRQKHLEVRETIPYALASIAPGSEPVQLGLIEAMSDRDEEVFIAAWGALGLCFERGGVASEKVGAALAPAKASAINSTRAEMIGKLMGEVGVGERPVR